MVIDSEIDRRQRWFYGARVIVRLIAKRIAMESNWFSGASFRLLGRSPHIRPF